MVNLRLHCLAPQKASGPKMGTCVVSVVSGCEDNDNSRGGICTPTPSRSILYVFHTHFTFSSVLIFFCTRPSRHQICPHTRPQSVSHKYYCIFASPAVVYELHFSRNSAMCHSQLPTAPPASLEKLFRPS